MNIVLFDRQELGNTLPRTDPRAQHVIKVLRRTVGDSFDAGVINGEKGRATITDINAEAVTFVFDASGPVPPAIRVTLVVGLPRPQTARDILRDATTLGVGAIHFVRTDKAESSYTQSTLWSSGEWRRHVVAGAEQAFDTRIPNITHGRPLLEVLATTPELNVPGAVRVALDNYEAKGPLSALPIERGSSVALAIGSERGWSANERNQLRSHGFEIAHLGSRVLRTETAVTAALTLVWAKLGLL